MQLTKACAPRTSKQVAARPRMYAMTPCALRRAKMCRPNLMPLDALDDFFDLAPSLALSMDAFSQMKAQRPIPVDVIETADGFQVKADLPGVPKENVKVEVDDYVLTISTSQVETNSSDKGDNEAEVSEKAPADGEADVAVKTPATENILRMERRSTFSSRSLKLPKTADMSSVKAKCENGVVVVDIAKTQGAQRVSRVIDIA